MTKQITGSHIQSMRQFKDLRFIDRRTKAFDIGDHCARHVTSLQLDFGGQHLLGPTLLRPQSPDAMSHSVYGGHSHKQFNGLGMTKFQKNLVFIPSNLQQHNCWVLLLSCRFQRIIPVEGIAFALTSD